MIEFPGPMEAEYKTLKAARRHKGFLIFFCFAVLHAPADLVWGMCHNVYAV